MEKKKIYLSSPHIGNNEIKFVNNAFETNWIAPYGPNIIEFENDLSNYLSENNHQVEVTALNSGTAALHLALIILGVKKGDEVICQSLTFSASAFPIIYQGALPVFVDSEDKTWNICPNLLEESIKDRIKKGKKPKAIIAVHLYGMPYQANKIRNIANNYEIPIIEDSAEALGSRFNSKKCGTLGDISILSFNGNKIITTSGGGALITHSAELKKKAIFLATQAKENTSYYEHKEIGYNYRMSNVSAGIGRGQMQILDNHIAKRREINSFYKAIFDSYADVSLLSEPDEKYFSNHWLSCLKFESKITQSNNLKNLIIAFENENIESRPIWKPMHLQPVFKDAPAYINGISQSIFNNGLCLPSGSNMTDDDLFRISNVLKNYFN